MPLRAVLWDVDDTLFDYSGADRLALERHLGEASGADAFDRWRASMRLHWARFVAGEIGFEEQRRERVRTFLGRPLSDAEADAWFLGYHAHYRASWRLFPDVLAALDDLAGDFRHAVLSNSSLRHQDRKLTVLGVRDRFEAVVCAAEIGVGKPAPAAFAAACEALRLPPGDVVYIGDEPDVDAAAATAAGLAAVWLDRGGLGGRPELVSITGLGPLPALLRGTTRFGARPGIG
ncbi:HAD family hydrolase [Streptomyces sp. NRRL F-5126]|uniref:HAD family hydrolase n=1 Tax=Streptomyces sp. NRRL F-5126 TaxID=1463857 RepID=UPI0004C75643|nr:HAD family hydrolase [Streptomyces sp. NRRL F-5126]